MTRPLLLALLTLCPLAGPLAGLPLAVDEYWINQAHVVYAKGDEEAARLKLDEGLARLLKSRPGLSREENLDFWLSRIWKSATFEPGRSDPKWALLVYDWIHGQGRKEGRWDWMCLVGPNVIFERMGRGMRAQGQELLFAYQDYLKGQGFSHDTRTFPDQGSWNEVLPDVRLRRFPFLFPNGRHVARLGLNKVRIDPEKPMLLDESGLAFLDLMGMCEWSAGRWQEAMEKNLWALAWAREVEALESAQSVKLGRRHGDIHQQAMSNLVVYLNQLGHHEKAVELADQGLAVTWKSHSDETPRIMLKAHKEQALMSQGLADDGSVRRLRELHAALVGGKFSPVKQSSVVKLMQVRALDLLGKDREADELLATVDREKLDEADLVALRLWEIRREIRRRNFAGLEKRLEENLRLLRQRESKMAEMEHLTVYAELCLVTRQHAKSLMAQSEVLRLIRAFNLYPLEPGCLARIAVIHQRAGNPDGAREAARQARELLGGARLGAFARAEVEKLLGQADQAQLAENAAPAAPAPVAATPVAARLTLQPRAATSMGIGGQAGKALFTLSNPFNETLSGVLRFAGRPVAITWDRDRAFGRVEVVKEAGPAAVVEQEVELSAGEVASFQMVVPAALAARGSLELVWTETKTGNSRSVWSFEPNETGVDFAVIDAGLYEASPFHLVPIHHHLRMKEGERANLRIVTSLPARVETYTAGRLAMVDAQGNGSLQEAGDQILWDEDRDGWPEISSTGGEAEISLYLNPLNPLPPEGLKVEIQWKLGDAWVTVAEDTLLGAK